MKSRLLVSSIVLVSVEALAFPVPLTAPGREDKARHYKLIELGIAASGAWLRK